MPSRYIRKPPRDLKHLPVERWPAADREAFERAFAAGDLFDEDAGPGRHLSDGSKRKIRTAYRRWLGYLVRYHGAELSTPPADRIDVTRVRSFVEHLQEEVRATSVACVIQDLYAAARLIAPKRDWTWLRAIATRLGALAAPLDRFDRLVPGWATLDLGIELMEGAKGDVTQLAAALRYRDGMIIALLSIMPMRRRALAALTLDSIEADEAGFSILLEPQDTKMARAESVRLPVDLVLYMQWYLDVVRPRLTARRAHAGLWPSVKLGPLTEGRIYDLVRSHMHATFGKDMSLHDFRRSAATFVATDAPELVGIIPGVLQHRSPEVGERWYNLARSVEAGRRHSDTIATLRNRLRRSINVDRR